MFYRGGGYMQAGINISNSWKTTKTIYTNINATWKSCKNVYINVSGTWKPIWSYSWQTGNWGSCTQTCGGGTQSRSVYCYRADGFTIIDSLCSGTKPSSSQTCNTQNCPTACQPFSDQNYWSSRHNGCDCANTWQVKWNGAVVGDYVTTTFTANGYVYSKGTEYADYTPSCNKWCPNYQVCRRAVKG